MGFKGIAIWLVVGINQGQEVVVDLLLADSEFLNHALARKQTVEFGNLSVPILTLEDLIILKTLAGRLQDQADLEKIRNRGVDLQVDWSYVQQWKTRLGL
jgi:predicted nucleotidyltransferase